MGQLENAAAWLARAQAFKDESVDLSVGLGELFMQLGRSEEAKKTLEKIYVKHNKDPQLLVSQANYYYSAYCAGDKSEEKHLRLAYKFYYPVLQQHVRNAHAANGLAIICAEKRENEAAREIFNKIRESNHAALADEVCVNLAHVYAAEGRHLDAERLYVTALKSSMKSVSATSESVAQLLEYVAAAQFAHGNTRNARKSMLRALHLNPSNPSLILNTTAAFEKRAEDASKRVSTKAGEGLLHLGEQLKQVQFAEKLLTWCSTGTALRLLKVDPNAKKSFQQRGAFCEVRGCDCL